MDTKQIQKIADVMNLTGCSEDLAKAYLEAEEWDVRDAVISLQGDLLNKK